MRQRLAALVVVVWMLASAQAVWAADLAPARIEAYIATLGPVRELGDKLKAEGKQGFLMQNITPRAGQTFDPHQNAVRALKRDEPRYYQQLLQRVQAQGFTSAESWASTGDRVVLAYGAVKVAAESPEMLQLAQQNEAQQQLLLQALPTKQRSQVEQAILVARALAKVPAADRAAVKPYIARLDKAFGQQP